MLVVLRYIHTWCVAAYWLDAYTASTTHTRGIPLSYGIMISCAPLANQQSDTYRTNLYEHVRTSVHEYV